MRTIKEARKNIALLWKRPKPTQAMYRPMKFLLKTRVEDGLLLYNVVTSEMVLADNGEAKYFVGHAAEYNPAMDELIARHFLVPEGFDENRSVQQLRALLKKLEPSKRVNGFTILPTTECNARCYYCFESDHPRCTMTDQIAADTVDYIAEKCKGEPVDIGWFGGEPLVGSKRISQICAGLKAKGIKYKSSMVSNAFLFEEGLIQIAKDEWKLRNIQITLDGTEEIYNETKAYVNPCDNPYRRVLRNIEWLLDNGIAVNVRLNVTDKNLSDLCVLIDELSERFSDKDGFSCYSHAVYDGVGFEPLQYDDCTRDMIDRQTAYLDAKLQEKKLLGSLRRLPYLRVINCMADNDACRLIYPDGRIGKCENRSSVDAIGDIYHDITDPQKDAWYKTVVPNANCDDCCLFPHCFDLEPCPEAGTCSKSKFDWKQKRYVSIMKENYLRFLKDGTDSSEDQPNECES
ncbi:MAG: 4Fe-4S cluster-binding domain-containing protein [Clostridiales bacterium]|nr:4Fe-4S cluster-binding domain-containing protein [Clostridiales bacterium]